MPLGRRLIAWARLAVARSSGSARLGVIALIVFVGVPLYLAAGLWFDLVYGGLGLIASRWLTVRVRGAVAAVVVVALVAALGSTSPPPKAPVADQATRAPTTAPAAAPAAVTASTPAPSAPSIAIDATPVPTAAPSSEAVVDLDDGATGPAPTELPTPAPTTVPGVAAVGRLPGEPDPALSPGARNPDVTQATINSTICVSGWTTTVRPSSSYTTSLKIEQIADYRYRETSTASYEEDHLIPLELGGAPTDPHNLWPEPYTASLSDGRNVGARVKDAYETALKGQVCGGTITLAAAQAKIGIHWVHAYYGIPLANGAAGASPTPKPTPRPTAVGASATLSVRFVSLPGPAVPGSTGSMTAKTLPGATCAAKVTWPSGTVSAAAGLKPTPSASSDGLVSWTWNVGSTTKPGTATASVTCRLGGSTASKSATFAVQ
jgi:hypothetical protein